MKEGMVSSVSQKKRPGLTQHSFDGLLNWLSADREEAGEKYETIRSQLIKLFICRGCQIPEELADETINRVAGKIHEITDSYSGDPALYFFGVAHNIHLEHLKRKPITLPLPQVADTSSGTESQFFYCLDLCLDRLSAEDRHLIVCYYSEGMAPNKELRRELARQLGIGSNALCIRAYRIRDRLGKCARECIKTQESAQ